MKWIRVVLTILALLLSLSCLAQKAVPPSSLDEKAGKLLVDGAMLGLGGKQKEAIEAFDNVIALYEKAYRNGPNKVFSARSEREAKQYLAEAPTNKTPVKVVAGTWAYAYYMKAYVLVELERYADAKASLQQAIDLAPHNSQFLSELGVVYQRENNWPLALKAFQAAETQAMEFTPSEQKTYELSRAWRGQADVYVEQKQWDKAEALYRKCWGLDESDTKCASQLDFIQRQKAKPQK
ncbi:Tetratricopeptide repeat protein [compost metagenome]